MAAAGARAQKSVGSAAWIATEKENMAELLEQEMEEVEYPVRHEMDWLNEHMTEIFTKGQANFADVFKTPGKMRGKTPRTARKRNAEDSRVPLSEIFSSAHKQVENKAISPSPFIHRVISKTATASTSAAPRAQDTRNLSQPKYPDLSQNPNSFSTYNTDSGYHDLDQRDEMILPDTQPETQVSTQPIDDEPVGAQADVSITQQATEDSFHTAQENVRARGETVEPMQIDTTPTQKRPKYSATEKPMGSERDLTPKIEPVASSPKQHDSTIIQQQAKPQNGVDAASKTKSAPQNPPAVQPQEAQWNQSENVEMEETKGDATFDDIEDIGSPSDGSTPERPLVRKSSLTFASLPAREPLTKSRISRTSHIDLPKLNRPDRSSYLGRQTGGHRTTHAASEENAAEPGAMEIDDEKEPGDDADAVQASKLHTKKSTQSLHERISMLGKLQPSRPKKSIPMAGLSSGNSAGQVAYPDLPASKPEVWPETSNQKARDTSTAEPMKADEEDWIKPLSSPQRPNLTKSKTTSMVEKLPDANRYPSAKKDTTALNEQDSTEPERPKSSTSLFSSPRQKGHQQSTSKSNVAAAVSTTPTGSPRRFDGPLSASKMRLQSIMKSAKGLFTSTGSTGQVDHSSPDQPRLQPQEQINVEIEEKDDQLETQPREISSPPRQEARRTRSSTEKEEKRRQKEMEERQHEEARQEKAREQERQRVLQMKAAQDKSSVEPEERAQRQIYPQRQPSREPEGVHENPRHAIPQLKQNDRRPKPTREAVQRPAPQPVSIRVGSTLSRMPMASSVSSNVQEANVPAPAAAPAPAPAPASKAPTLKKKGSNQSLQTSSSASSLKGSVSSQTQAQRKAQLANERKREQEEREARRKEDRRREHERQRAAQQQHDTRQQAIRSRPESRAEAQREQRERSAQEDPQKAAHMQAIEKRRLENARRHERQGSQQLAQEGPMLQHEKASSQSSQRSDLGASRAPSRLGSAQPYGRAINPPAPNPAKPPKRNMDEEAGQRPTVAKPRNVQPSGEAKRRKTEDEHGSMQPVRPTMAPPIRQSNIRKPSMFGPSGKGHPPGSSIFKSTQPQRPAHPMDMAQYTSGKIPFAEPSHAPPSAVHKPSAPVSAQRVPAPAPAKPSPKYPSGENIHLPEIATDSEDEDDSDSEMFPVPKWAQPKELEGLLRQQDGMEVDSIFGPIAPFSLEETFKADKKIKKYRDRTSSANWNGPDGLTQDEVRKDIAERQRLRLNGGWSWNP